MDPSDLISLEFMSDLTGNIEVDAMFRQPHERNRAEFVQWLTLILFKVIKFSKTGRHLQIVSFSKTA